MGELSAFCGCLPGVVKGPVWPCCRPLQQGCVQGMHMAHSSSAASGTAVVGRLVGECGSVLRPCPL
jgi:hypothetical protein